MKKSPKRSIVIACVALVVAVGGTSYAAAIMQKGPGTAGQVQSGGAAPDVAPAAGQVAGLKATTAGTGTRQGSQATAPAAGIAGAK